ncbi:MAG: hypothetical protein DCF16_00955 [Alphaproteobacteria bacterium]|nr:MAG: hypothetical protein DCF16_00955 [Alphaproteobacteria bacterium]
MRRLSGANRVCNSSRARSATLGAHVFARCEQRRRFWRRSRRRQGYATEACTAVIDWLFEDVGAETILAGCDAKNVASVRTLRRLGFWLDSNPGQTFWWVLTPDLRPALRA